MAVSPTEGTDRLHAHDLCLRYGDRVVAEQLSVSVPDGSLTMVIGPNACGKSTLLRSLARLLVPETGSVVLDGADISTYHTKEVARRLGLLPQTSIAPDGITVADLIARGRFPHQGFLRQWSREDDVAVGWAMEQTNVTALASRYVDELSGGQRQRVWLAMALAQDTPLLLLDEPTTYLDIGHQIEVLDLCAELHERGGRTIVVVMHELNHAARYASHLIVMRDGAILAQGLPRDIVTAELIEQTFDLPCRIIEDPESHTPIVIPAARVPLV
ncbi:MAG: ABC transporter ATP-binding protein [Nocardioides sp.]|uniref:ABC transporter ATP-binding protein n=1 Tax=Nocardioides sp. TaxID=35761 RepID=UPI0039E39D67